MAFFENWEGRKPSPRLEKENDSGLTSMYTPGTEVLSMEGFKPIESLEDGDKILTRYSDTNIIEWEDVEIMVEDTYEGKIHWFETRYMKSPKFISNSFLFARPMKHEITKSNEAYSSEESNVIDSLAEECETLKYYDNIRKPLIFDHKIELINRKHVNEIIIGEHTYDAKCFFYWLGLVATDGSIAKKDPVISITQCKEQNIPIIIKMMDDVFKDRWKKYEYDRTDRGLSKIWHFNIYDRELHNYVSKLMGRTKIDRRLNKLFEYSKELLEIFLDGALLGDGWNNQDSNNIGIFCGVSEDLAKDYQIMLAFFGRRSNVISKDERGKRTQILSSGNYIETKNILWRISIHRESASSVKRHHHKEEDYKGRVFCPDTINELFYVRREGMSLWMSTK